MFALLLRQNKKATLALRNCEGNLSVVSHQVNCTHKQIISSIKYLSFVFFPKLACLIIVTVIATFYKALIFILKVTFLYYISGIVCLWVLALLMMFFMLS